MVIFKQARGEHEVTTYTFPAEKLEEAIERIEKANRRAAKSGITEQFTFTTETFEETYRDENTGLQMTESFVALTLNVPAVKVEGWTFIATLAWDAEAGLITRTAPGQELTVRPTDCHCDVCKTERRRNDTYLLRNEKGEEVQVGSGCLQRFLGIFPNLWALNFEATFRDVESEYRGFRGTPRYGVKEIVQLGLAVIHERGWASRAMAQAKGIRSTSEWVFEVLSSNPWGEEAKRLQTVVLNSYKLFEAEAAQMIETIKSSTDESDYITNLRAIVNCETVEPRNVALLVSIYAACKARKEQAAKQTTTSQHIGAVGQKLTTKAVVKSTKLIDGYYGETTLIVFVTAEGNVLKWFASGDKRDDVKVDDEVTVTATVKEHSEFNGVKETLVTRAKIS